MKLEITRAPCAWGNQTPEDSESERKEKKIAKSFADLK